MNHQLLQFSQQIQQWHQELPFQIGDPVVATWQGEEIEGIIIGCCLAGDGSQNEWDFLVANAQEAVWYSRLALRKLLLPS
ncbi:MAG: hypothetical protein ACFBSC_00735 [Microcoleaceae cyanobacterium]